MSTNETPTTSTGDGDQGGQGGTYTPPATQADLDRIITDRLARDRARFADYDEIKAKAEKFDQAVEADKTELQKALDRAEAAEAVVAGYEKQAQVAAWAADIVKGSKVPADALRGDTEDALRAHFDQLQALIPTDPPRKGAVGPYLPAEGGTLSPTPGTTVADRFAEAMEGRI